MGDTNKSLLKSFVIGSSAPVFIPFFYGVTKLPEKTFDYKSYMFRAPLYFGTTNILRIILRDSLNLTDQQSFYLMSQLSPAFVSMWITYRHAYNFPTKERWYKQYALLWLAHSFTWLVTIQSLEKTFNNNSAKALL